MLIITIEGTNETLIDTGRNRRCTLCGNLFEMGSLHGFVDFDDEGIDDDTFSVSDEIGNLACSYCIQAGIESGPEGVAARMSIYAGYLETVAELLVALANGKIALNYDPREVQYTGKVSGGPLMYVSPPESPPSEDA